MEKFKIFPPRLKKNEQANTKLCFFITLINYPRLRPVKIFRYVFVTLQKFLYRVNLPVSYNLLCWTRKVDNLRRRGRTWSTSVFRMIIVIYLWWVRGVVVLSNYPSLAVELLFDYPFPSCLINGENIHIVCSIGEGRLYIITAYRPLPDQWEAGGKKRGSVWESMIISNEIMIDIKESHIKGFQMAEYLLWETAGPPECPPETMAQSAVVPLYSYRIFFTG
jgi:hypothetical protein